MKVSCICLNMGVAVLRYTVLQELLQLSPMVFQMFSTGAAERSTSVLILSGFHGPRSPSEEPINTGQFRVHGWPLTKKSQVTVEEKHSNLVNDSLVRKSTPNSPGWDWASLGHLINPEKSRASPRTQKPLEWIECSRNVPCLCSSVEPLSEEGIVGQ